MDTKIVPGSFRDPSGFLFYGDEILYRQINTCYSKDYELLVNSGLYDDLVANDLLIPHEECDTKLAHTEEAFKVIKPFPIPFISYPYEWSFSQLKDSARLTLEIQRRALKKKMSLKDASAYNIQFFNGKPIFVDTLSFQRYEDGDPWIAYRQFCQHFLAPLALMSRTDIRLNQLLRIFIDGVPLDLAKACLPYPSRWNFSLGIHISMHARSQRRFANKPIPEILRSKKFSTKSFFFLLDSLDSSIGKLTWEPVKTEWYDYYECDHNYGKSGFEEKEKIVSEYLDKLASTTVWDIGANTGRFSRIAASKGALVIAWDIDPGCVEANYRLVRRKNEKNILPLILDLANPSPGLGWNNNERISFLDRGPADTILALGVLHHLCIVNNLPLHKISSFLKGICNSLIIEFIPKTDSQVQRLLINRKRTIHSYDRALFEDEFKKYFRILDAKTIRENERILYLMKNRANTAN